MTDRTTPAHKALLAALLAKGELPLVPFEARNGTDKQAAAALAATLMRIFEIGSDRSSVKS
ncbi:hypothetical protein [Streptomyces melanogenes]|uniref:hypothetical protein n=1 Tax=Streptomyces melanogenes TaxID=67326 RepID=UPI00167DD55F|nr:hypothetical protein [Streptomyces melanogenes]GGP93842.1 hypothetical protein GCM10010278_84840 [Streptomyces melanogenes]